MERSTSEFVIRVHRRERILEVVYPSHPNLAACEQYDRQIRAVIEGLGDGFDCLVDQRAVTVAPQEVSQRILELNAWARQRGMRRSVRVVNQSAIAELQARRILRESGLEESSALVHTREEAWQALRAPAGSRLA